MCKTQKYVKSSIETYIENWELILQIRAFGAQWDLSYKQGIINSLRNFFNT